MSLRKSPQKMTLKATSSPSLVRSRDKKKTERTWNVDENKGSRFLNLERTWNVIENKCTYVRNPGMLLKRQQVSLDYGMGCEGNCLANLPRALIYVQL